MKIEITQHNQRVYIDGEEYVIVGSSNKGRTLEVEPVSEPPKEVNLVKDED